MKLPSGKWIAKEEVEKRIADLENSIKKLRAEASLSKGSLQADGIPYLHVYDKDLKRFATNILKALNSK